MKVNSGQAPSTLVPEYLGSDFDAVLSCADNMTDIKTVVENLDDIEDVVNNIGVVTTVAPHINAVQDVADNLNYVHDVIDNLGTVTTVASNIHNVNAVAPHINDVDVVSNNMENVVTVLNNLNYVKDILNNISDVTAVGFHIDDVDVVANNIGDVNTVANNIDDMGAVATNIEYVKGVAEGKAGLPVVSYIGVNPPPLVVVGAEWYCTTDGRTYIWYVNEDSGQWVEGSPQSDIADSQRVVAQSYTVTIADDAVSIIMPPAEGTGHILVTGEDNTAHLMGWYCATSSPESSKYMGSATTDMVNTELTGTTGTDGNITIGVQDNLIYLENRNGATSTFKITFIP